MVVDWTAAGVVVAGVVPIGGAIYLIISTLSTVKAKQEAHEELDNQRFESLKEDVGEIKDDVKTLLNR